MRLELSHCCYRELSWECELTRRSDAAELASALAELGYVATPNGDWLLELIHPAGQRFVVVPRTGRVQLRLHYDTPAAERRELALSIAAEVERVLSRDPE